MHHIRAALTACRRHPSNMPASRMTSPDKLDTPSASPPSAEWPSLIGAPVRITSAKYTNTVGCVCGDVTSGRLPVLLGSPLYKTVHLKRTHVCLMDLEADEGNKLPFAVEEGSFNAFVGLAPDILRRIVLGACDHAALRIVREAFLAYPYDWSFGEAVEMMRVAWGADVRRGLVSASAMDGGVAHALWLCIYARQKEDALLGKYRSSGAAQFHCNASMVLLQLAFKADDPKVLTALYKWTPDWRIRKVRNIRKGLMRGTGGCGSHEEYTELYVSSSAPSTQLQLDWDEVVTREDEGVDYTYEMAESHPEGCPRCVLWLRKRNQTARAVCKARRAANLLEKRKQEALRQAMGREAAQATLDETRARHDAREAAMQAEASASDKERACRLASDRERQQQGAMEWTGTTAPGPSHREPKNRRTLQELGMQEQVTKQQWREDKANRAAQAEEKQRVAHDSATARKVAAKQAKVKQQHGRRAMAAEAAVHVVPSPPTLADYYVTSSCELHEE